MIECNLFENLATFRIITFVWKGGASKRICVRFCMPIDNFIDLEQHLDKIKDLKYYDLNYLL